MGLDILLDWAELGLPCATWQPGPVYAQRNLKGLKRVVVKWLGNS